MRSTKELSLLFVAVAALAGCGGGGGGGGEAPDAAAAPAPAPADSGSAPAPSPSASSPAPSPSPSAPAPSPSASAPSPAPAPSGPPVPEPWPSLASPQAGSTAAGGNDIEGLYRAGTSAVAFVDPDGKMSYLASDDASVFGSFLFDAQHLNWSFDSGTANVIGGVSSPVSGSGAWFAKNRFGGTYTAGGTSVGIDLSYAAENALAVSQESLAGTWSIDSMTLTVSPDGSFTGTVASTTEPCKLTGAVTQATPGSSKNLFRWSFVGTGAACTSPEIEIEPDAAYTGFSGILLTAAGTTPADGYYRTLVFHARTERASWWAAQLHKQ